MRKAQIDYNHKVVSDIEKLCTSKPRDYWSYIKKLGPRKINEVPLKVYTKNGQLVNNIDEVLGKWKQEFETLLNRLINIGFDNTFYDRCIQENFK